MCMRDDCEGEDLNRRAFLAGSASGLASFAASRVELVRGEQEKRLPETRILDSPELRNVELGKIFFRSAGKEIDGYLARPRADAKYPAVLVLAGNRITEEYIPNTCAALALAGFVGFTPNNYHAVPDTAKTVAQINKSLEHWTEEDYMRDCLGGVAYLRSCRFVDPARIAVLGFCVGGRRALLTGARSASIRAVVAFHPGRTTAEEIVRLKAPVQIHHGTQDRSISIDASRDLEKALRGRGTPVELFAYEKADHGFLAYTRPQYDQAAAKLAWKRTVEFLDKNLKR
jgi:carboxymethylenebutenolidase